jgi:hypothetical protein
MAAVAELPVAMVAVGEEPPVEVATAAARSSSQQGTSRPSICDGLERRRWASCVRSLDPLPIGGLWCGSILARGAVWPNGLTAWPAPFTIVCSPNNPALGKKRANASVLDALHLRMDMRTGFP